MPWIPVGAAVTLFSHYRSHSRPMPLTWLRLVVFLACAFGIHDTLSFAASLRYAVQMEDSVEGAWASRLQPLSETVAREKEGAVSLSQLRRRAEKDKNLFRTFLRSEGFYACEVAYHIDPSTDPLTVRFTVNPGPLYVLEETTLDVSGIDASLFDVLMETTRSSLPASSPALAAHIADADQKILSILGQHGHPLARISERRVIVRHDARTVHPHYVVSAGPKTFFGPVSLVGLESVREDVVRPRIPWKEGDLFDTRLMTKAQDNLIRMDLFSVVRLAHGSTVDAQGRLPVEITVVEKKPRTFKGGFFYSTDVGPELNVSWENRIIRAGKAKVGVESWLSSQRMILGGIATWRDFLRTDQLVQVEGHMGQEDWDAYWTRSVGTTVSVVRDVRPTIRASAGAGFRLSSVEQASNRETYGHLFLPAFVRMDTTDNPLDPARGFRWHLQTSPYWDLTDTSLFFWKTSTSLSTYYDWSKDGRLVLASIVAAGSIAGATQGAVPADLRFYVGGGGSVRGYEYQSVGPRDGNDPVGGRSFLSWNGEVRWRMTQRYGLAAFLDGGTAYESPVPDFTRSFRWATGLGFRYYSPLGPFRMDVAFPLNRRAGIDDAFQIYISLGQAF
ncbi:autotransporter secretion outer membrane protein TamA [Desulfosoma caldarium]|uniref:Autotransporter secretion outer membrane protein TamA n=2 Tax=Desulfosoma caldarium TaxID=610254 RepID=A0A3N1UTI6_9BACT|nr:autotransporter secretion outer membrane protein TamA [Desulfosoma caldarium]